MVRKSKFSSWSTNGRLCTRGVLGTKRFGIVHAGWRGLVRGILEEMQSIFSEGPVSIRIGPLLPVFEIQKIFF